MSIDYFLQSKSIYNQIEFNLKNIVDLYEEFIELTNNEETTMKYNKEDDIKFLQITKYEYQEKIKQVSFFKEFINKKIVLNCEHNFVKDTIDISSELSQEIEYCIYCEFTK